VAFVSVARSALDGDSGPVMSAQIVASACVKN
jgi:hypothetical protein